MSVQTSPLLHVLLLLLISGVVVGQPWCMGLSPASNMCAVMGSSVTMDCEYTKNAYNCHIVSVYWRKEDPNLYLDTDYSLVHQSDSPFDCSLRLYYVTEEDQRLYKVTYALLDGRWLQGKEVWLSVTGLQVEVPESVVEGDLVTLSCKSTCSLTNTNIIWYKNGLQLYSITKQLHLLSVRYNDDADYSCGAEGTNYQSPPVTLNVQYPPKSVSVSISGEIEEGNFVTLSCSSDANPPVETYTWYKGTSPVKTGKTYYIYRIGSEHSGDYKCEAGNKHGRRFSTAVSLNVLSHPKSVSVSISASGEIVEGSRVTLTCRSEANPPVETYTWFKGTTLLRTGKTYTFNRISSEDSGDYTCEAKNQNGRQSSAAVSLNVLYPPKSVSMSVSPSGKPVEGSTVTLTCSSDANPPVETYTWYKGRSSMRSGKAYTIYWVRSEDSGDYKCEAENEHGHQSSPAVSLNVLYPPKSVSVSISPSGEIVENSSVTLSCSSDANPPVQTYTWYKRGSSVKTGKTYTIDRISSEDRGDYKCEAENERGRQSSSAVSLNVQYPPRRVSASISASGEPEEGSTVTLTCSSDANPPVETYTWYKGGSSVKIGQTYTIDRISSEDREDYKCEAENSHGRQSSSAVSLNVLYPPKSVSVSISPSGEPVEGSTVTLTCSSDANPPVETYTWYKGGSFRRSGNAYTIDQINSEDSGDYMCEAQNKHGNVFSTVSLNVLYPPKRVSVSISTSGETVEGSTVTLTCRSDAKPPVETYTWYKEKTFKSKGKTYTINNISTEDGGDYRCKAINQHGFKYSNKMTLNVLYPPKTVSISTSGEPVEGSTVTLTCSSDANPPVETYTWYKGNESSPVGSGQSLSFTWSSSSSSGWFYCVAQNKYGSQTAAGLVVASGGQFSGISMIFVVTVGVILCVFTALLLGFFCIRRKKKQQKASTQVNVPQTALEGPYLSLDPRFISCDYSNLINPRNQQ